MKNLLYILTALLVLASCNKDDYFSDSGYMILSSMEI